MNKITNLLKNSKSVSDRAEKYGERIATSLKIKILNTLEEKIEKIDDEIFDLENISLDVNINKGQKAFTKEEIEERFEKIINLNFERDVLQAELDSKKKAYDNYFSEVEETE